MGECVGGQVSEGMGGADFCACGLKFSLTLAFGIFPVAALFCSIFVFCRIGFLGV